MVKLRICTELQQPLTDIKCITAIHLNATV